jgi:muramidase (phage lysozyme)
LQREKQAHAAVLGRIEHNNFVERTKESAELLKHSDKFSEQMKGVFQGASVESGGFFQNLKTGFGRVSENLKDRSKDMASKSFADFGKDARYAAALKKKRESSGDDQAQLTKADRADALAGRGKDLFKGLTNSLEFAFKGTINNLMKSGIGIVIEKIASIAGSFSKMMEPLDKTFNVIKPLLNFFETILGTWGEMLEGIMGDMYSFRKEMTMSAGMATKTATQLQMVGDYTVLGADGAKRMRESWDAVVEYTNSYVTDLGKSKDEMNNSVVLMSKISKLTGISAQESASFVTQMNNGLQMSVAETNKMVVNLKTDAQSAGLNFKFVMQDVAKEGSRMAMYGERISGGIMKAAIRARELGGSLKTWTGLMDGFGDSWEGVVGFATDFNRLAGGQVMDAFQLKAAQVTGDVEKVQNIVVGAMKNVKNEADLRGHLGKRFQQLLGIDDDEYAKLVERVHVEKIMEPALKNIDKLVSSMKGSSPIDKMFGLDGLDDDKKRQFSKVYADWEKGMKAAGKNVNDELRIMQERALVTAAQDAVKKGIYGDVEEFSRAIQAGDEKAGKFLQDALKDAVNFPDFKSIEEALEESMNPQDRMEVMIKEIARSWFPKLISIVALIAEGLAEVVDFLGGDSVAKEMRKVSGSFKLIAATAEESGKGKDIIKMSKNEEMKRIFETYLPGQEVNVENSKELMKQLEEVQNKLKGEKDEGSINALKNVTSMMNLVTEREKASADVAVFSNQAKEGDKIETIEDLSKTSGQLGKISKTLEEYGGSLSKSSASITETLSGFAEIADGNHMKGLKTVFVGLIKTGISFSKMLVSASKLLINSVIRPIENVWGALEEVFEGIVTFDVEKIFDGMFDLVSAPIRGIFSSISDWIVDTFGKAGEFFIKKVGDILDAMNPVSAVKKGISAIGEWFGIGPSKPAGDIAFDAGEVVSVIDKNKQMWTLDPQDKVVASTNFDFSSDNISTGVALQKGALKIDNEVTTRGLGGSKKFYPANNIPEDVKDILEGSATNIKSSFVDFDPTYGGDSESVSISPGSGQYTQYGLEAAKVAKAQLDKGIVETPPKSNKGKGIDEFLKHVGLGPGYPWCAAFASYVWGKAGDSLGIKSPVKSGGVGALMGQAKSKNIFSKDPTVGAMALYKDKNRSHVDIVTSVDGNKYSSIGGNQGKGERVSAGSKNKSSATGFILPYLDGKTSWLQGDANVYSSKDKVDVSRAATRDIAYSADGGLMYLVDKWGNVYGLGGEGAVVTPNINFDSKIKSKIRNFMEPGGIYEKFPVPQWWQQKADDLNMNLGKYVDDIDYLGLAKQGGSDDSAKLDLAQYILKGIGYSDDEFNTLASSGDKVKIVSRLYNELMYGADPKIQKNQRIKDIDWNKLKKAVDRWYGGGAIPSEWNSDLVSAIMEVESGGSGFANYEGLGEFPKLRFEPHVFNRTSKSGKMEYTNSGRGFSTKKSETGANAFLRAKQIDENAAIESTSYGKYQLMGHHWQKSSGSPQEYLEMMKSERGQDKAFIDYINSNKRLREVVLKNSFTKDDVREFSRVYNGPSNVDGYSGKVIKKLASKGINIADAYFGKGDVLGIMTPTGMYSPRSDDAVAVGTKLPNNKTNTKLQEGELSNYLSKGQTTGTSYSNTGNDELVSVMRLVASLLRKQTTPAPIKAGNVYLDGMNVGRTLHPNISGHGNNLNGG